MLARLKVEKEGGSAEWGEEVSQQQRLEEG